MITYNGKEYRNLQEQVKKNQEDIELLTGNGNIKAGSFILTTAGWSNNKYTLSIPDVGIDSIVIISSTSGLFTSNGITAETIEGGVQFTATITPAAEINGTYTVIPGHSTAGGQAIIFDYGVISVNATFYQEMGVSTSAGMSQSAISTQFTNFNNRLVADESNITSLNTTTSYLTTNKADKTELPEVVQVIGASKSAVMSQDAVSTMLAGKVSNSEYEADEIKSATIIVTNKTANVPANCQRQNGLYLLVPATYTDYVKVADAHLIIDMDASTYTALTFAYNTQPAGNVSFILYSFNAPTFSIAMSNIDYKNEDAEIIAELEAEIETLKDQKAIWGKSDETIPCDISYVAKPTIENLVINGQTTQKSTPSPDSEKVVKNTGNTIKLVIQGKGQKIYLIPLTDTAGVTHIMTKWDTVSRHDDGKWYFDCQSNSKILDATNTWTANTNFEYYHQTTLDDNYFDPSVNEIYSNYYPNDTFNEFYTSADYQVLSVDGCRVRIKDKDIALNGGQWLDRIDTWATEGNPLTVWYKTINKTSYELCSDTQDILNSIQLMTPRTVIFGSTVSSTTSSCDGTFTCYVDPTEYTKQKISELSGS